MQLSPRGDSMCLSLSGTNLLTAILALSSSLSLSLSLFFITAILDQKCLSVAAPHK